MKAEMLAIDIERSEGLVESDFGISDKAEDVVHLLSILRDKLYSDKIYAVVREYSTNAVDAHVEAGCPERPIRVTLPTQWDMSFRVRDFGYGLSEEDVRTLYVKYGASTKRATNDAIGQLGLGCKSGFAYGESFMVVSFYGGTKNTYNAYIDESGVGKIALMESVESDEPSGVEIIIPVRRSDVQTFRARAMRTFRFFDVKPEVIGCSEWERDIEAFEQGFLLKGVDEQTGKLDWAINTTLGNAFAVMGNIAYPIESDKLPQLSNKDEYLFCCPLLLRFPIGALSIAANREALEYTASTRKAILEKARSIHKTVVGRINKEIEGATSLLEAKKLWQNLYRNNSQLNYYVDALKREIKGKWRGYELDGYAIQIPREIDNTYTFSKMYRMFYGRGRRYNSSNRFRDEESHYIKLNDVLTMNVFLLELDTNDRWKRRAEAFYQEKVSKGVQSPQVYVINWHNDDERKRVDELYDLSQFEFIPISTIEPLKIQRASGSVNRSTRAKHQTKVFKLKSSLIGRRCNVRSDYWEPAEVDLKKDKGIYFEIDRFFIQYKGQDRKVYELRGYDLSPFNLLKAMEIDLETMTIYGFKPALVKKIAGNNNWIAFEDWLKAEIIKRLKSGIAQAWVDRETSARYYTSNVERLQKGDWSNVDPQNSLKKYVDAAVKLSSAANKHDLDKIGVLIRYGRNETDVFNDLKPSFDLDELQKQVLEDYPLFKALCIFETGYGGCSIQRDHVQEVIEYTRTIDAQRSGV